MILIICEPCSICLRVMGDAEEIDHLVGEKSDFWPNKFVCPTCEKTCVGVKEIDADPQVLNLLSLMDLGPEDAFKAMHGMGLPHEGDCRAPVVDELLRTQPIRKVKTKEIPHTHRCRVDWLELWDGTRMYFGAGAEGAVVYRITKPVSHVKRLDDGR
jgi:hypothetical protein